MQLTVDRSDLRPALAMVAKATADRTSIPILTSVLVVAEKNELILTATDLMAAITIRIPAEVDEPGAMAIDAGVFGDWISNVGTPAVRIETDARGRVKVHAGRSRATLPVLDAEDYPKIATYFEGTPIAELFAPSFRSGLEKVTPVANPVDSRATFQGVWLKFNGDSLMLAASDTFRVSRFDIAGVDAEPAAFILPRKAAQTLLNVIPDDVKHLHVARSNVGNLLIFKAGDLEVTTALLDGALLDLGPLMGTMPANTATLDRKALIAALRGSRSLAKTNDERVSLELVDGQFAVHAQSAEYGEIDTQIDAVIVRGRSFVEGIRNVNSTWLAEVAGVLGLNDLRISFSDNKRGPLFVTDPQVPHFTHMMMPLIIGNDGAAS